MSETKREKIIGIDLGTTNSAAAVMMGGNPVVIPSAEGPTVAGKMFPSVVAFTKEGRVAHPGYKVPVVDTTAAGDSFAAAFIVAWLQERPSS